MRYSGPVCRICRREDMKLFLKGERCYTEKCGYERRPYAPGQHGQSRKKKLSAYGEQLREKQKVKRIYGIAEKQFRGYYHRAARMKGITGENLLILLERRLDNVVHRLGFASDHADARQLVRHGHVLVNGKRVDIPSYLIRLGDTIHIQERSKEMNRVVENVKAVERRGIPAWLEMESAEMVGKVRSFPSREDLTLPMREQLIVELYSK